MPDQSNSSFFGPKADFVFLSAPLILSGIFFLLTYTGLLPSIDSAVFQKTSLIVDIFLLGTLHNVFTFWVLLNAGGAAAWLKGINQRWSKGFTLNFAIVSITLFIVFGCFSRLIPIEASWHARLSLGVNILMRAAQNQHALWQTMGISFLFFHFRFKNAASVGARAHIQRERTLYFLFFVVLFVPFLTHVFSNSFGHMDLIRLQRSISVISSVCLFAIAALIILNQIRFHSFRDWQRIAFSSRLLVWSAIPLTPYAYFVVAALHGIEYAFITKKLSCSGKLARTKQTALLIFSALVLMSVIARIGRHEWSISDSESISGIVALLYTCSLLFQHVHIWLDRLLFSMRMPESKAFTGYALSTPYESNG